MAHDGSVTIGINGDDSGFKSALSKLGSVTSAALKGVAVAATAATTAIVAVGKQAIEAYASYEQLVGGIETLFKDSADIVQKYASDAYKTAGLSANDYMETVTSFSASLLQSVGGDTAEAARIADMAITDMADNANKMGTSMESIQYAYQGFAKQNYTMLDNLKLGYGGTKQEMERLLEEAERLSGVEYDISNLNDVYEAIHVIQTELGISGITAEEAAEAVRTGAMTEEEAFEAMGTTAKEAATTIQGSFSMMQAAWQNLLVGMADETQDFDQLLTNFLESVGTVGENLIPRMEVVLGGVVKLVSGLGPKIAEALPGLVDSVLPELLAGVESLAASVAEVLPGLLDSIVSVIADPETIDSVITVAADIVMALVTALTEAAPQIVQAVPALINGLISGVTENLPMLVTCAIEMIDSIVTGLIENLPMLIDAALELIEGLVTALMDNIPLLLDAAVELVDGLVTGITDNLPMLLDAAIDLIMAIVDGLIDNLDELVEAAVEIVVALAEGLLDAIPKLLDAAVELAEKLWDKILETDWIQLGIDILTDVVEGIRKIFTKADEATRDFCDTIIDKIVSTDWIEEGRKILEKIVDGLKSWFSNLRSAASDLVEEVKTTITETDWLSVGSDIISGIANGISGAVNTLWTAAQNVANSALSAIKNVFGIASPSKVMDEEVGQMIPPGIGRGVQKALPKLSVEMRRELEGLIEDANISVAAEVGTVSRQISGTSGGGGFPAEPRPAASGGGLTMNVYVTADASQTPSQARSVGREIGAEAARAIRRKGITIV